MQSVFKRLWFESHQIWCQEFYAKVAVVEKIKRQQARQQHYHKLAQVRCIPRQIRDPKTNRPVLAFKLADLVQAGLLPSKGKLPKGVIIRKPTLQAVGETIVPYVRATYIRRRVS